MKATSLFLCAIGAALLGLAAATTHAAFLFSDGDFEAQTVGLAVGAPWGPVGDGHLVAASSQSPYSAVYPDNGKGAHIPATADNIYLVRLFPENAIPASSTETLYFNVDFRNNSAETGDYSIVITRDASGGARSVALYVSGDTLYADSAVGVQSVLTLQQGIWYNLRLTLDLATRTYAGVVKSSAGTNVIPSRPFVQTGEVINCVYTDGGTSFTGGTAPDHDLDNWALSNTPLEGTPFVKSVSPVGRGHKPDSTIRVELRDASTQVAPGLVELLLDGQVVLPTITKDPGSPMTTVSYVPPAALASTFPHVARIIFGDTSTPPVLATNEWTFQVADPVVAARVVNVDFNGLRTPDVLGPTYEGVGAGGGGRIFNGIVANSILPGGGDDDNLTVGAVNLTDSFGGATTVSFTVSPMGGDVGGVPTADPQSPAALFSDYIFNNSAGNHAGESPFQISGLGAAPFVDLYFYHTFQTGWRVTIPGVNETAFPGQGIFTSANTYYFKRVPVVSGMAVGTFGSGTTVICGLSIVSPLPRPFIKSAAPIGPGARPEASITIELEDYVTEVVGSSIELFVNGAKVAPAINKPEGSPITTVSYAPPGGFAQASSNAFTIIFGDSASPSVVQTNEFSFGVLSEASAALAINIDLNGLRNVPGPDVLGPTYAGQGAAGGGTVWNGLLADSKLPDGSDDDAIMVSGTNLLNSIGGATPTSFTISPVGGDNASAPAGTDPASASALLGDYVFVATSVADLTIGGLGTVPYIDLYFYYGANGDFTIPDIAPSPFAAKGVFTPANTLCFKQVPVTNGTVTASMGIGRVSILYGISIQKPLPQPYVQSFSPSVPPGTELQTNQVGIIQIVLRDYVSQVVTSSIQLSLNGQVVTPQVTQEAATGLTTVSYDPYGALRPGATNLVRLVFSDNASPAVVQTHDFEIVVMDEAAAGRIINIDFNGLRNVPGPDVLGPTYEGQGAAGGGRVFNGIVANSILPGGGDDDNLTVGAVNLLGSLGNATTVSFTVSPVGGDVGGAPTTDPQSPAALFSDYIFNNSAGNSAGRSPFTIGGLESTSTVDLYFYRGVGSIFITGEQRDPFAGTGIFTPANTYYFAGVPVTDGKVVGSFGDGVTVIYGMTIVLTSPRPGPLSIGRDGNNVIISWPGPGTLQVADEVTGAWTDLPGATNPLILVSPHGYKFYRLRE